MIFPFEIDAISLPTRLGRLAQLDFFLQTGLPGNELHRLRRGESGGPVGPFAEFLEFPIRRLAIRFHFFAQQRAMLDEIGWLIDVTDAIVEPQSHLRSSHHVVLLLQAYTPLGFDLIFQRPIGHQVGIDHRANLAQFGVALGDEFAIDLTLHFLGAEEYRPRFRAILGRRRHLRRRTQGQRRPTVHGDPACALADLTRLRHANHLRGRRPRGTRRRTRHGRRAGRAINHSCGRHQRRSAEQRRIDAQGFQRRYLRRR